MNIQSTLSFLRELTVSPESDESLVNSLISALNRDGYSLKPYEHHYLRHLAESTSKPGSENYTVSVILVTVCVICAGCASGLTQGLLSLDYMEMTIKARSGTPTEQKYAAKVLPVISQHHLLLVTLMLWNACANEALPIFLNALVPEFVAIIVSVTLVLFVGEIIPASILTGPSQLMIAANMLPMVYCVIVLFFPIAYPIAKVLDYVIGHDSGFTVYNKKEITTMMALQHEEGKRHTEGGGDGSMVHHEEVAIIGGALKFREMCVTEVMTPISDVYMIPATDRLDAKTLFEIFKSGYSRIPVYDKDMNDVIGLILAKDLIFVDVEDETPVRNFVELFGRKPAVVWHDDKLGETLSMFRNERAHMAMVRDVLETDGGGDPVYTIVGVITLEDIIEEILGAEIHDETDNMEESEFVKSPQFRDMDFARLKLLNTKMSTDQLTNDEVRAIVSHLNTNVPAVRNLFDGNMDGLTDLVRKSSVMNMKRKTPVGSMQHVQEDMIYRRGKVASMCTLILSGNLTILAGKDEFLSEKGPWSMLGVDALIVPEGTYIPDFSAYVASENIRFVSISMSTQSHHHYQHHHEHHQYHAAVEETQGGRARAMSRGSFFGGAHSLAERKQSMHKRRSTLKDAMGQSMTDFGTMKRHDDSLNDIPVLMTQSEKPPTSRSMSNAEESKSSAEAATAAATAGTGGGTDVTGTGTIKTGVKDDIEIDGGGATPGKRRIHFIEA